MSLVLQPTHPELIRVPTLLTAYAAVAVCQAIEATTDKKPQIKWVNDVFLEGKKICGILTETTADGKNGNSMWIVTGIGINFTAPETGFPDEIKDSAGALFSRVKPTVTRNRLIAEIINCLLGYTEKKDSKEILAQYRDRLILGRVEVIFGNNDAYIATSVDIDDIGRLVIRKDKGDIISLDSGEIRIKH